VAGVTGDGRGNPAAGVDVHQTQGRIRGNPQRRSLGGRAVQPLGHETDVFQQRGDVVTQRQTFVLYTNQNDDFHRLALVVPDAVDLGRAQLLHLFGDDLLGLDRVIGVLQLQSRRRRRVPGVVRERRVGGEQLGHGQTAVNLVHDVVAVHEHV